MTYFYILYICIVGRKMTPFAFVKACDIFLYTDELKADQVVEKIVVTKKKLKEMKIKEANIAKAKKIQEKKLENNIIKEKKMEEKKIKEMKGKESIRTNATNILMFYKAFEDCNRLEDIDGVLIDAYHIRLKELLPSFSYQDHGSKSLKQFIQVWFYYIFVF